MQKCLVTGAIVGAYQYFVQEAGTSEAVMAGGVAFVACYIADMLYP